MTGKDYQIFDTDVGMMDLTYSNAWSLGRLAGISDSPFNAALLHFRERRVAGHGFGRTHDAQP
jgi:hypothetical protein